MAELGVGYLSIIPETSKIAPGIKSALGGAEKHAEPSGKSMGGKIAGGIGSAVSTGLKTVAGGAVAAGVAGIGTAMVKGFQRLDAIDNANAKLTGLGHSASSVQSIMDDSLASVKGTAFGLGEAASLAAGAVASGIKPGQELQRVLSLTGDAATIAGTSMGEMGSIFNKVAATGKVQGDVLNQLGERGIPIIQMLAAEMGVTAEEAVKMASEGKIGFETFADAMESQLGGAALEGAKTVSGALANLGAAAGRLGAEILGPGFSSAPAVIGKITGAVDSLTAKAGPAAAKIADMVGEMDFSAVGEHVGAIFSDLASTVSSSGLLSGLGSVATSVGAVASAAMSASPAIVSIAGSLAEVGSSIGVSGLSLLATTLDAVAAVTSGVLAPALATVAGLMESQTGLVTAAVVAWGAFKTVPSLLDRVKTASSGTVTTLKGMATANESIVETSTMGAVQMGRFGSAIGELGKKSPIIAQMQTSFVDAAAGADRFGRLAGTAAAGMTGLKAGAMNVIDALGGPWTIGIAAAGAMVADYIQSTASAKATQEALNAAATEGASAQRDLASALGESAGAMDTQALAAAARIVQSELDKTTAAAEQSFSWATDLGSAMDRLTYDYDDFSVAMGNATSQIGRDAVRHEMAKLELQALGDAARESGVNVEDAARIAAEGGPLWDSLRAALSNTGSAGEAMAEKLEQGRDIIAETAERAAEMGPGYLALTDAMDVLTDSAASAEDRFSALRTTLELLGFITPSAEQAMMDLAAKTEAMAEAATAATFAADEFDRAFFNTDGTLNLANTTTHQLAGTLGGMRDQLLTVAAANGDVGAAWAQMQPELDVLREKLIAAGQDYETVLNQFSLTPELIEIMVQVDGLDDASGQVVASINQLRDKATNEPIPVELSSEDAVATLEALGVTVTEFNAAENRAMVQLDADHALRTAGDMGDVLDIVGDKLTYVDGMKPTVNLDADTTTAQMRIDEIVAQLDELDETEVSPAVSAIIDEFMANRDVTVEELEALDTTVVSPEARLLIEQLLAQARIANSELDNTARPRTATITPVLGAGSIGAIQSALNSMHFTAPVTGTMSGFSGTSLPTPRGATGMRVPRRAEGGRLPTTGPGTDRTDGILGVSSETGMPTSFVDAGEWVIRSESSEEYDGVLGMINRDDPRVRHLKGFQTGGRVGRATKQDLLDLAWGRTGEGPPLEGNPYRYGGIKWGDCSSAQYAFAAKATGRPPFGARFSTSTMATELARMGFTMGSLGGDDDYNVGWYGHGTSGHTVGAIGRTNVEMGGAYGGGKIGGTASPWQSIYTQKAHYPLAKAAGSASAAAGFDTGGTVEREPERTDYSRGSDVDRMGAPRSWSDVAGIAAKSAAEGYTSDLLSLLGLSDELPPALQAAQEWKASERARAERIAERDEAYSPGGGASESSRDGDGVRSYSTSSGGGDRDVADPGSKPATGWGDMVAQSLEFVGLGEGLKAKVLDQIDKVSGGDPDYVAPAPWSEALARHHSGQGIDQALAEATARGVFSAMEEGVAMGLMGITATRFARYRDDELPDDEFHPMANVVAKLNEAIHKYGSIEKAWADAPGFWNGGTARHSRDVFPAWLADGEEVTRTADAERGGNRDVLQAMRAGATFSPDAMGGERHTHYHVADVEGALRRQRIDEGEKALIATGGGPIW